MPAMTDQLYAWHGSAIITIFGQAGRFKQAICLFCMPLVSMIGTARFALDEGVVDLVGMTRGHIADPYIIAKLQNGEEDRIRSCVGSTYCSNYGYCIQNPATAREGQLPHVIAPSSQQPKKVVVVGAGPGGLGSLVSRLPEGKRGGV